LLEHDSNQPAFQHFNWTSTRFESVLRGYLPKSETSTGDIGLDMAIDKSITNSLGFDEICDVKNIEMDFPAFIDF
jgi:hypothetical protein